jgi:hypothetical protein
MSDAPQGPDWWLASDGKWYPPSSAPHAAMPPPPPTPGGVMYVQQQTNGLAVASLVLGIIWLYWIGSILALVFGYVAKSSIDRSGGAEAGRGMAVAGIVLGWIGVGILSLILIVAILGSTGGSS